MNEELISTCSTKKTHSLIVKNICTQHNCEKQYSKKCSSQKCRSHCKDVYCVHHKLNKTIYEPSKLPDPSLLCVCTSYNTRECINGLCMACCNDEKCCLHKLYKKYKDDIADEYDESELGSEYAFCSKCEKIFAWGDGIYNCDGCCMTYCDICEPYNKNYIRCEIRDCYYCRRGRCHNNRYEEEMYCTSCFVSNEPICDICGLQNENECWACDDCEKTYCYNCENANTFFACDVDNCNYCAIGNCRNSYMQNILCDICNKKKNTSEIDLIKLIDEKKYDNIFKIFNYNIKYYKTPQTGKCCICLEKKINCKTECKHGYCVDCFIKNTFIHKNKNCSICRASITNNVKLYNMCF